jgi:hypothetical protein
MNMTLATRVAIFSGTVLLAFVVAGFVLAVTLLPSGGHQLGGLLLGDTDLGPPWVVVALYVVALWLLTRKGWPGRVGALVMALCGLGYTVAQLSSIGSWFSGGRAGIGIFVAASAVVALGVVASVALVLARSFSPNPEGGGNFT